MKKLMVILALPALLLCCLFVIAMASGPEWKAEIFEGSPDRLVIEALSTTVEVFVFYENYTATHALDVGEVFTITAGLTQFGIVKKVVVELQVYNFTEDGQISFQPPLPPTPTPEPGVTIVTSGNRITVTATAVTVMITIRNEEGGQTFEIYNESSTNRLDSNLTIDVFYNGILRTFVLVDGKITEIFYDFQVYLPVLRRS